MLEIKDLYAQVEDKEILRGLNLHVEPGTVHAIMGPNGAGKSTLANVIAGCPGYMATAGSVCFAGQSLLDLAPEERAALGIFLGFQYPVEVPGVNNAYFLKMALNAKRQRCGQEPLDAFDFLQMIREYLQTLKIDEQFLQRPLNVGFSGGEKKRNEVLQMLLLQPQCAILDETDSGLDIDALQVVAAGVNQLRAPDRCIVLVTHYQRLLNFIKPDKVHVMVNGRIVASGGSELALELENTGYKHYSLSEADNA